jgi:hypothetical protein
MSQGSQPTSTTGASQTQTTTPTNWGALALGGLQTLGNFFSPTQALAPQSDRRAKTDIVPVGKDPATGIPLHSYRYKGDPKTYPKIVGPMAQDVQKVLPGAVRKVGDTLTVHPAVMGALTGTDTVPAMLTPGEAVLTDAAAKKMGRKTITKLNDAGGVRHYAAGTSSVAPDVSLGTNPMGAFRPRRAAPGAPDFTLGRGSLMPTGLATRGALAAPRAGAKAFSGALANTKRPRTVGVLGG